jgi:hypothetical protein
VPINSVKIISRKINSSLIKYLQKLSARDANNNSKKIRFAFTVNKFILIKLMTESNGLCANNAQDGFIPNVLILIQDKTQMLNFNA